MGSRSKAQVKAKIKKIQKNKKTQNNIKTQKNKNQNNKINYLVSKKAEHMKIEDIEHTEHQDNNFKVKKIGSKKKLTNFWPYRAAP